MYTTRLIRILALLLVATSTWAGVISRPVKTCGTTNFATESSAGCKTIKSAEVDSDLNTIFSDYNGNITNANVATAANISGSKLADGTVTSAKITDGTIVNADVSATAAIAGTKLGVKATVNAFGSAAVTAGLNFSTVETSIVSIGAIATRGSYVMVGGSWDVTAVTAGMASGTITFRVKRNGATFYTLDISISNPNAGSQIIPISPPLVMDVGFISGNEAYSITAQTNTVNVTVQTGGSVNSGIIYALEMS